VSSTPKAIAAGQAIPARTGQSYRVAIIGAGAVRGKEVVEVLHDRNFPASDLKLLDEDEAIGQLETAGDEVTFIQSVSAEKFERVDFTFFAADQTSTRKYWKTARNAGSALVDLTSALEDQPDAVIRSPWIERQLGQAPVPQLQPGPAVVAHSAAIVLALLLLRMQKAGPVAHATATVLEPASEHGQKGMDELHEQTVNLLSFQPLPKNIYDIQIAFNMVGRYGDQAKPTLASVEERIFRHYKSIAGADAPSPSLLLVQAPIFHGHAFALHVEMEQPSSVETITQALTGEHISISTGTDEAPSNVNAAGHGDILVSVAADRNHPQSFWLWAAADNLRLSARNAVECAESMAASRPLGKIQ
jgi:aspartate-semialdehyde dehydrogenase